MTDREKVLKLLEEVSLESLFRELGDIFWERFMKDRRNKWYLDLHNDMGAANYTLNHKRFDNDATNKS